MKKVILISLALIVAGLSSVYAQSSIEKKDVKQNPKISEVTLSCKMECGNCADAVKKQLAYTKGVKFVSTDFEKDLVVVKFRNDRTDIDQIIASLAEIKYTATVYKPGCPNANKGCCSGSSAKTETNSGCGTKTVTTDDKKSGCCSGKTTESTKK
jgi:copper chaperone CopZ